MGFHDSFPFSPSLVFWRTFDYWNASRKNWKYRCEILYNLITFLNIDFLEYLSSEKERISCYDLRIKLVFQSFVHSSGKMLRQQHKLLPKEPLERGVHHSPPMRPQHPLLQRQRSRIKHLSLPSPYQPCVKHRDYQQIKDFEMETATTPTTKQLKILERKSNQAKLKNRKKLWKLLLKGK